MQEFFDINVDITKMSTEELKEARRITREMLSNIEYQLYLRKIHEHKFKPN